MIWVQFCLWEFRTWVWVGFIPYPALKAESNTVICYSGIHFVVRDWIQFVRIEEFAWVFFPFDTSFLIWISCLLNGAQIRPTTGLLGPTCPHPNTSCSVTCMNICSMLLMLSSAGSSKLLQNERGSKHSHKSSRIEERATWYVVQKWFNIIGMKMYPRSRYGAWHHTMSPVTVVPSR